MSSEAFSGDFFMDLDLIERYVHADNLQHDILELYGKRGLNPSLSAEMTSPKNGVTGLIEPLDLPELGVRGYFLFYPDSSLVKRYTYLLTDSLNQRGFIGYITDRDELTAQPLNHRIFSALLSRLDYIKEWCEINTFDDYSQEHWQETHARRASIIINSQLPH